MKKIIALAVAGAFAVPAMAAEVSVNGEIEFVYATLDDDAGANTETVVDNGNLIKISATEEVDGLTITAGVELGLDGETDDAAVAGETFVSAQFIKIAGDFGAVTVGDTSGALDNFGDYSDQAPFALGFSGDGSDHAIRYDLPSVVPGLRVSASMTPEDGAFVSGDDEVTAATDVRTNGVSADASGFGAAYAFGDGEFYYGQQTVAATDTTAYGVKYSVSGLYVAYETATVQTAGASDIKHTGYAATYAWNNMKFIYEDQKSTQNAADTADDSAFAVEYNLGSNVDIFAEQRDDKFNSDTYTYVGVEYNF